MANTLTITNIQLYRDTRDMIESYGNRQNPGFRNYLRGELQKGRGTFKGKPLKFYVWLLSQINPLYRVESLNKVEPERFLEILDEFYNNLKDRNHLSEEVDKLERGDVARPDFVTTEDHEEITNLDNTVSEEQKEIGFSQFVEARVSHAPSVHYVKEVLPETPQVVQSTPGTSSISGVASSIGVPVTTAVGTSSLVFNKPLLPTNPEPIQNAAQVSTGSLTSNISHNTTKINITNQPALENFPRTTSSASTISVSQPSQTSSLNFAKNLEPMVHIPSENSPLFEKTPGTSPIPTSFTKPQQVIEPSAITGRRKFPGISSISAATNKIPVEVPIGFKKITTKFLKPQAIASVVTAGIGTSLGFGMAGNPGALFGGIGGAAIPSIVKQQGVTNFLTSSGKKIAYGGADIVSGLNGSRTAARSRLTSFGNSSFGRGTKKRAWLILLALLLGLLLFNLLFLGNAEPGKTAGTGKPGTDTSANLQISKKGTAEVDNGQEINYQIKVTYTGTGTANITVSDPIPTNMMIVEAVDGTVQESGSGDSLQQTAKWTVTDLGANQSKTLLLAIKPKDGVADVWVSNTAEAIITSTTGATIPTGPGAPPNSDTCGGKWKFKSPLLNFGDPTCNFNRDKLYDLLKQLDPINADFWFYIVVLQESGYDPSNYAPVSTSGSAWGLFQMGHDAHPELGISKQMNNQFDRGDVPWELQTSNAVNYQKLANNWRYWEAAKSRW